MAKKKTHDRAKGKTSISISLDQKLVDRINELAESENRNRSNFIVTYLQELADKADREKSKGGKKP